MRTFLIVLMLSAVACAPAMAGRNANGAMVVHTDDAIGWSSGWDYCTNNPLPLACEDLNPTSMRPVEEVETIFWAVGSFIPTSSPAVTAYQFGVYHNLPAGYFVAWGPCGPGALQIPDATFPDESGTGVAVAYGQTVYPAWLMKMYWFAAYGVQGGFFSIGPYPNIDPPRAQWADDGNPPAVDDCYIFGTLRWGEPGQNGCGPMYPGACCFPDCSCRLFMFGNQCADAGGVWLGSEVPCEPNPCSCPVAACCLADGSCAMLLQGDCEMLGGNWFPGEICPNEHCAPLPQACCLCDGSCVDLMDFDCTAQGGVPGGPGTQCATYGCPAPVMGACCHGEDCTFTSEICCGQSGGVFHPTLECEPNPCLPSPTKATTWGRIKADYR
jgi:hypothetical protein